GLEKDQDNQDNKRNRFEECLLHFMDRFANRDRRVVDDGIVQAGRKTLLEFSHFLSHRIGSRERIRARELVNRDRGRRFSAESAIDGIITRGEFNPRDIAYPSHLASSTSFDDDFAKLFLVGQPALRTHCILKCSCAFWHWRGADDSGRDLHILL